jgi:ABC-type phosphate transport system auxiliary subunit
MKVTIFRVQLSHLWNSEYCMFVSQSLAILLKFGMEGLHLKKAFDRVQALMPEIAKIKAQELGNVISNQLADLNTERRTLVMAMMDHVKNFGRLSMPDIAPHVAVLNRFFDKHGRDIGTTNYNDNTQRFNDFMADYDSHSEIEDAATAMQLVILFDQLRAINKQFATLYLQRDDENSSVEKVDAVAIRAEMDKALTALFDTFEIFSTEYEELDYQTPANKLNELISHYKTQLKARETRRHEGKDVHTEAPITAPA